MNRPWTRLPVFLLLSALSLLQACATPATPAAKTQPAELTGQQLLDVLTNAVSQADSGAGRFLQVAGLRFEYQPVDGGFRLGKAEVKRAGGAGYEPVDPNARYTATTLDYLWKNGYKEDFSIFSQGKGEGGRSPALLNGTGEVKISWRKTTEDWIEANPQVRTAVEGRIVRLTP